MKRLAGAFLGLTALLGACMATPTPAFTTADHGELDRVAAYLNAMPRFEAHFDQTGSFGPGAGLVWLDRPGNLRIDYQGPAARLMVIGAGRVRILDRSNGALTTMPLSRTPLGLLLTDHIALSGAVTVDSLTHSPGGLRLMLKKTGQPGQGVLTLDFSDTPLQLLAVSVTDARGQTLTMHLSGIDPAPTITPDLFVPPAS